MSWAIKSDGPVKPAAIPVSANRDPPILRPIIMAIKAGKLISLLSFPVLLCVSASSISNLCYFLFLRLITAGGNETGYPIKLEPVMRYFRKSSLIDGSGVYSALVHSTAIPCHARGCLGMSQSAAVSKQHKYDNCQGVEGQYA